MTRWLIVGLAAALAGCAGTKPPPDTPVVLEVARPCEVAVPLRTPLPSAAGVPAGVLDRGKVVLKDRAQLAARVKVLEAALAGCTGKPLP